MKRFEHSLSMKGNSWHARWYRHWVKLGGKRPEYKENLCHYVRVLLFWAPQRWFWRGKIGGIPPWAATLLATVLSFIVAAAIIWPKQSLEYWLTMAALVVLCVIVGFAIEAISKRKAKAKRIFAWVTFPLWIIPFLVVEAAIWIWNKTPVKKFGKWFFTRWYVVPGLAPVTVVAIAGLTALGIWAMPVFLKILLVVGVSCGIPILLFAALFGLIALDDAGKLDRIKSGGPKVFKSVIDGTSDTVKLGYTYVKTKKQGSRICPFIEFEQQSGPKASAS